MPTRTETEANQHGTGVTSAYEALLASCRQHQAGGGGRGHGGAGVSALNAQLDHQLHR